MSPAAGTEIRELSEPESDGVQVLLLWHPGDNDVTVSVEDARDGGRFALAVAPERALDASTTTSRMPPSAHTLPHLTARDQERDARRRYLEAIAAALESLRLAEQRFDASAAAIDGHIESALMAAGSLASSLVAALGLERANGDTRSTTTASTEGALA